MNYNVKELFQRSWRGNQGEDSRDLDADKGTAYECGDRTQLLMRMLPSRGLQGNTIAGESI